MAQLLDDYSMVSFIPLDVSNDERYGSGQAWQIAVRGAESNVALVVHLLLVHVWMLELWYLACCCYSTWVLLYMQH